jgi:glutathione-specific gamma-glutamylcyclotransferase
MAQNARLMRLTLDHVAQVAPYMGDPPPLPTAPPSAADYANAVREILATVPSTNDVWLFAYGSLIWNPACDFVESRLGTAHGWRRSFCLGWDRWFRGSEKHPGLMLSLDRGGQCRGVAYRLPADAIEANLERLFRREIRTTSKAQLPRWVNVETTAGALRAIAFVINRKGTRYVGGLSLEDIADTLAVAAGPVGSMAEYLCSTVRHLEELGLHDRQLWRLQELVAERIETAAGDGAMTTILDRGPEDEISHHKIAPNADAESSGSGSG